MSAASKNNVIKVPPRRRTVYWRGLHGVIEYRPALKAWQYILKLVYPVEYKGEKKTEAEAELEVKKAIEIALAGKNKNVRSVD